MKEEPRLSVERYHPGQEQDHPVFLTSPGTQGKAYPHVLNQPTTGISTSTARLIIQAHENSLQSNVLNRNAMQRIQQSLFTTGTYRPVGKGNGRQFGILR